MIQYECTCNFGISGVTELPSHDHNQERMVSDIKINPDNPYLKPILEKMPLRDSVHIWVNWKAVAKALSVKDLHG